MKSPLRSATPDSMVVRGDSMWQLENNFKHMNWYLAKFVYQVISENGNHAPKFDEQVRLIRADEYDWAIEKANILGRLGESSSFNERKETVQWKFIDVVDLCSIKSTDDGDELFSSVEVPENVGEYLANIKAKASRLQQVVRHEN